jgi:hypothetical protein
MTTDEYRAACEALRIDIQTSAQALCISRQQAYRYAWGESVIPEKIAKLLRAMVRLGTTEI